MNVKKLRSNTLCISATAPSSLKLLIKSAITALCWILLLLAGTIHAQQLISYGLRLSAVTFEELAKPSTHRSRQCSKKAVSTSFRNRRRTANLKPITNRCPLLMIEQLQIWKFECLYNLYNLLFPTMESQSVVDRMSQSCYRQSLIEAKAESCIKRHQVRAFINAGSGSSEMNLVENDENSQLAEHLLQLKSSCSGVKVDIRQREHEQFRLKDETQFAAEKVRAIQQERAQLEAQIIKLKTVVEEVKNKKLNASLGCKSYEHVLDRMRKDQIRYQIRRNQLEQELKQREKTLRELNSRGYDLKQHEYLSASGLREAQGEVGELASYRSTTLSNMNSILEEKNVLEKKKQQRREKSDMIKQMAAGDLQDADLIRMKKFLTVQQFLKALLKGKIEKLKDFYEPYELAFLKIKSNTNVKDANSLKAEYHHFEASYSEKSSWVKHLEDEIARGEEDKKQLQAEYARLKEKELQIIEEIEQQQGSGTHTNKKELQYRADQCQIMMMSMKEWLAVQAKRLSIDPENKNESVLLRELCQQLKKRKLPQQVTTSV